MLYSLVRKEYVAHLFYYKDKEKRVRNWAKVMDHLAEFEY